MGTNMSATSNLSSSATSAKNEVYNLNVSLTAIINDFPEIFDNSVWMGADRDSFAQQFESYCSKIKKYQDKLSTLESFLGNLPTILANAENENAEIANAANAEISTYLNNLSITLFGGVFAFPFDHNQTIEITSDFGSRILKGSYNIHEGVDFMAKGNDKTVLSVSDGEVVEFVVSTADSGYGTYVVVKSPHPTKEGEYIYIRYAHLSASDIDNVKVGDTVTAGTSLGTMGSTGYATGPHLHLDIREGSESDPNKPGLYIDPLPFFYPEGTKNRTYSTPPNGKFKEWIDTPNYHENPGTAKQQWENFDFNPDGTVEQSW